MKRNTTNCKFSSRRDFLHVGCLSLLGGLSLPTILESAAQAAVTDRSAPKPVRNVIMIWLSGGPSTIDMWDLKPNAASGIRGEFKPIKTSADGIEICEHLPQTAKVMDQCALIRSVSHTIAEHGLGTEYVSTGNPISPALKYPSIGSVVSHLKPPVTGVPSFMDLSQNGYSSAGFLGASFNPVNVDGFNGFAREEKQGQSEFELPNGFAVADLSRRRKLLSRLDKSFRCFDQTGRAGELSKFQQQAVDILLTGKTRDALDLSKEDDAVREKYGRGGIGRSALAARRLIQSGVRFVTIGISGWDTHADNFGQLKNNLLPQLDRALGSLVGELNELGMLDETIVYCTGEFNRTPSINGSGGRDHWARSMSMFVAGGNFKRGFCLGATDKNGYEPASHACSPADVNATILSQLGIEPNETIKTRSNRPVEVFRNGKVIDDLIAD